MIKEYRNYIILALVLLAFLIGYKIVLGIIAGIASLFISNEVRQREEDLRQVEKDIDEYEQELKEIEESRDKQIHQELEQTEKDLDKWLDQDL